MLCTRKGRTAAAAAAAAVSAVEVVVESGGEGRRGKVKGRCKLRLAVKMSMGTVVAEEKAATAAVIHGCSMNGIEGKRLRREDLSEKWGENGVLEKEKMRVSTRVQVCWVEYGHTTLSAWCPHVPTSGRYYFQTSFHNNFSNKYLFQDNHPHSFE